MRFVKQRAAKRIIEVVSIVIGAMIVSAFVLRSVYAISLFHGITNQMENSGWVRADSGSVMQPGEELTYEASYLFFKIGAVKFQVLGKTVYDSVSAYRLRADIDSYSGIPFVNVHAIYDTYADARTLMCLFTSNSQKEGDGWLYTSCNLRFAKGRGDWKQSKNGVPTGNVVFSLDKPYTDGLSFFYYLREASMAADGERTQLRIPIIVDTVRSSVDMTINEKEEPCSISAYKYPIESYKMSGHINFTGFFGVTGGFTGWMSADSAEIPLKGNVNVILGSIVVQLKNAGRAGWVPPRSIKK